MLLEEDGSSALDDGEGMLFEGLEDELEELCELEEADGLPGGELDWLCDADGTLGDELDELCDWEGVLGDELDEL